MNKIIFPFISLLLFACVEKPIQDTKFVSLWSTAPSIDGKPDYLTSPMLTAGNRIYMVGHQDGSFPELGWHITGEMGGIWNHPIKLMDGFEASLSDKQGNQYPLEKASKFTNYPAIFSIDKNNPALPKASQTSLSVLRWSTSVSVKMMISSK